MRLGEILREKMRMQKKLLPEAQHDTRQNRRSRIWKNVVVGLACVVVFFTTYALILPALTLENDFSCGMSEHIHTENCYAQKTSEQITVLNCTYESLGVHAHIAACSDAEGVLACGEADYVVHEHDSSCFDEMGMLICKLPRVKAHQHTEACYQAAETEPDVQTHVHGEECYTAD